MIRMLLLTLSLILLTGCGSPTGGQGAPTNAEIPEQVQKLMLPEEPRDARGVCELRKSSRDGDEVVLIGRIGGSKKSFTGRAAFTVVDLGITPCDDDGCGNPWCSVPDKQLKESMALVRFADVEGKTLAFDISQMPGVKELATVVVRGKASRDSQGNLTVVASGLHVRKE